MDINALTQGTFEYSSHDVTLSFEVINGDMTVKINEYLEVYEEDGAAEEEDGAAEEEYYIFEIYAVSSMIKSEVDVEIKNEDGELIGFICFGDELVKKPLNQYTKIKLVGLNLEYISDIDNTSLNEFEPYVLNKSYALIHSQFASEYKNTLLNSSGIWGGFSHSIADPLYKTCVSEIVAMSGIKLPTIEHENKLRGAVSSNNGFDRFLKKYHMLELLYDYICVLKLKTMESSIKSFRRVMQEYSREEFKSLKLLLDDYVMNVDGIVSVMESADEFGTLVTDVFHVYSKDSNPIKDEAKWNSFHELLVERNLSLNKCKSKNLCQNNNEKYRLFILNVATYWIYRIRCSIAHNKIGEFIFEPENEDFVVEIGEKLLDCVISQVLSNLELKEMFDKEAQMNAFLAP
ncbi:hypothetical protein [Moritella marina]|uniref:hypothetical protein n=1 Tax=Moritella marina TaxID=90736 RepID=UPI0002E9CEF7|nr:hypothetical protein [Moritella marina]